MPDYPPFSCFIIGEETLLILCAQSLLEYGHHLYGIISTNPIVVQWAEAQGIPHHDPTDDMLRVLKQKPFDYLFSIINQYILTKEMLELPRKFAINYHDALLPRYAGTYASSWALMHGETMHGITWHIMNVSVDTGYILKQAQVEIAPDETSFSLNMKCYDAAHRAFAELAKELTYGSLSQGLQDLSQRSFFPRYKRPAAAGLINWHQPAAKIDPLVRGLNFGPYPNQLNLPKILIETELFIIPEVTRRPEASSHAPGTLIEINASAITVATEHEAIEFQKVLTPTGQPVPITELRDRFGLAVGYRFTTPSNEFAQAVTTHNGALCKHEEFWVKRLAAIQPLTLPYRSERSLQPQSAQYACLTLPLPTAVTAFLEHVHPEWPLNDFLLAAFAAYLSRIGAVDCFDIGFKDCELRRDLSETALFFAPYVPLRIELKPNQNFGEVYAGLQEQIRLLHKRKTFTTDVIARYPSLRTIAQHRDGAPWPIAIHWAAGADEPLPVGSDLIMVFPAQAEACQWIYNSELIDPTCIAGMARQWTACLLGIVAQPEQQLSDLPLLSTAERDQLLNAWNATQVEYAQLTTSQLFERQVEQTPNQVAVIFEGQSLTYAELNCWANQLAHHLQSLGVGPDVLVGICVERSLEMIVGVLGILKAGGAYVPIDPNYPNERLATMLTETALPILVTQESLRQLLPLEVQSKIIVCLDAHQASLAQQPQHNPNNHLTDQNLAYVIFTSGSTGKLKGVAISHHNLVNAYFAWEQSYQLRAPALTHLQLASLSFDVFSGDLVRALGSGGTLVICPQEILLDPQRLYKLMLQEHINCAEMVPVVLRSLIHYLEETNQSLDFMQLLVVGSDSWYMGELNHIATYCGPNTRLINSYGLTEATIDSTYFEHTSLEIADDRIVPIGRPFANTTVYLLDPHAQPVPIGIPGELYLGGMGLARYYLNRPQLTAERFGPDPFISLSGQTPLPPTGEAISGGGVRLYRTGDMARYLPDGNIEFLGRMDHQVKVRGFRIELGEIEVTLSQQPGVQACVVVARADAAGEKQLVAYVVPTDEARQSTWLISQLRSFLRDRLPAYMVPAIFMLLEALPLTPNCKVDRNSLPTPGQTRPELDPFFIPPSNPTEQLLANIWAEVLCVSQIGIHDNFFHIGGHSLRAIQIISRVQDAFKVNLPLRQFFEMPTISGLTQQIEAAQEINRYIEYGPLTASTAQ